MKPNLLPSLASILILCLAFGGQAQNSSRQNKPNGKQISFLLGYTPVHIGSKIDHDKRLAVSFRLTKAKLVYDFDVEYYTSDNSWSRQVRNSELLLSTNSQKTSGLGLSIGIAKAVFENTHIGVGLSANYFDISQSLNESVIRYETGEEIIDHGLSPGNRDARFLSPGIFLQTDLSLPIKQNIQFYLRQKFNWMYIADHLESSFFDFWISYTVHGGLRLNI